MRTLLLGQTGVGRHPVTGTYRMAFAVALILSTLGVMGLTTTDAKAVGPIPRATLPLGEGEAARPTKAWVEFCERLPAECAVDATESEVIALTPKVWSSLVAVNREVNEQIKPSTDEEHWGVADRWDFAEDGKGDCEDYQLVKRKRLIEQGLPRRALRMTVVIDEEGQGHAVILVRTDRGDFVLDNKRHAVLPWSQTGYTYIKRECHEGRMWVSLDPSKSPHATAASR